MQNTSTDLTKIVNMKHRSGNETRNHRKKKQTKTLDGSSHGLKKIIGIVMVALRKNIKTSASDKNCCWFCLGIG